jgi:hypothetical protein
MKWSKHALVLLLMNLGLLAAVGYLLVRLRQPTQPLEDESAPAPIWTPRAKKSTAPTAPVATTATNDFRWTQLESEDYRTYILRLRAVGCPEQTIRDLIIADIDKLMAPRVQSIMPHRKELKYWQPEEEELWNNYDAREWLKQQRDVDFEKRAVIRELLGVDLVGERLRQQGKEDYHGRRLGFLPDEKRSQVRTILDKFNDDEFALREKEWEEGESLSAADRAQLTHLRQSRQAELAKVLSPSELEQYDLWLGYSASKVRDSLYGMDASEDEFRRIYNLRKAFDQQWQPDELDLNDANVKSRWEAANAELDHQIQAQIGPERFALYERGRDPEFKALNQISARYSLPTNAAVEVYSYRRIAQEARATVHTDPSLTGEQRDKALQEISQETEKTLRQMLGDRAYNYYRHRGYGTWIK